MRLAKRIAILCCLMSVLAGCETTTIPPDASVMQPTQQEENQQKIQQSMQW